MKTFCFIFIFSSLLFSQAKQTTLSKWENTFSIVGGMGVQVVYAPDMIEYVNSIAAYTQQVDKVGAAVDFFCGIEIPIGEIWNVKIEHAYLFKSYSVLGNIGETNDFFYSVHTPYLILQKVFSGYGYVVKIGAGGGYHLGFVEHKVSTFGTTITYTARGIGLRSELVGQTAFDEHLYGYISGSIGGNFVGTLEDENGKALKFTNSTETVSLQYFQVGLRFGITYFF